MKRIKRERTKGWRMPENSVYVGRPSKLGNPFYEQDGFIFVPNLVNKKYHIPIAFIGDMPLEQQRQELVNCYRQWLNGEKEFYGIPFDGGNHKLFPTPPTTEEIREFVNGRDPVCWCSLDKQCHADVIIKILAEN